MSILDAKKRALFYGHAGGVLTNAIDGSSTESSFPIQGLQSTRGYKWLDYGFVKETFGRYNSLSTRRRTIDMGHSFYTRKDWYSPDSSFNGRLDSILSHYGKPTFTFEGVVVASLPDWSYAAGLATPSSDNSLDAFGTSAIAKVRPLKPTFDAAVNVAELLREGLPRMTGVALLKSRFKDARKLGDEWLNLQFGIQPLVSGIRDGFETVTKADKLVSQIQRDNGRVIRRRFVDDPVTTTSETILPTRLPVGCDNTYLVGKPRALTRVTKIQRQRWFSGAFTYYLPPSDGYDALHSTAKKAEVLYGVRLDADVLWNLLPWSWAADWVTNAGDVISNIAAFSQNGLVMRYGYVMETTTVTVTDSISVPRSTGFGTDLLSHTYGTTVKVRRRATPYGFGLNEKDFTSYQWGIIGALGISNAPKRLR